MGQVRELQDKIEELSKIQITFEKRKTIDGLTQPFDLTQVNE